MNLTPQQRRAVESPALNKLIVAGPGSGKTTVLVLAIAHLVRQGIDPQMIIAITFTNEAAGELRRRLRDLGLLALGYIGTLHSYCLRLLQSHGHLLGYAARITVLTEEQSDEVLRNAATLLNYKGTFKRLTELRATWNGHNAPALTEHVVVGTYYRLLKQSGSVDYPLILRDGLAIIRKLVEAGTFGLDAMFVDEYQDTAPDHFEIYRELPAKRRFYVGDPDQCIFEWNGSDVRYMVATATQDTLFEKIYLEENFRCVPAICDAANRLIEHNAVRVQKRTIAIRTDNKPAITHVMWPSGEQEELQTVIAVTNFVRDTACNPSDCAILARTNAIVDRMLKQGEAMALPVNKRRPMPPDWILARRTIEMLVNPRNDLVFSFWLSEKIGPCDADSKRATIQGFRDKAARDGTSLCEAYGLSPSVYDVPLEHTASVLRLLGVSESTVTYIAHIATTADVSSLAELAISLARDDTPKLTDGAGVTITTLHASKGREWENVWIVGADQNLCPGKRKGVDVEAERRLFYVAITRAKSMLVISNAAQRKPEHSFKYEPSEPSQFLAELAA